MCKSLDPRVDHIANVQILAISIYLESNDIPTFPFGKRATIYPGVAPMSGIFLEEVMGKHIKKPEVDTIQHGTKTLELHNLKTNVEDVEDIGSMGQTTPAREGKMLVTGKPLVCRDRVSANKLKCLAIMTSEISCEI